MSQNKIIIGSSCGGVGDNLVFTPIFKKLKNVTFEMVDHPKARNVATLLEGLCEVSFVDKPRGCPESSHPHTAQKKIEGLGINDVNCIPQILLKEDEITWAKDFLAQYMNPIALVIDNNGSGNPSDINSRYRIMPTQFWQNVVEEVKYARTILQFGVSNNFTPLKDTVHIVDLPLRKLAACYHIIKQYSGIDTGDYHLMLAVGGVASVIVPPTNWVFGYVHEHWHYIPKLWKDERCRVHYYEFQGIDSLKWLYR
jgi:hypothetical protein